MFFRWHLGIACFPLCSRCRRNTASPPVLHDRALFAASRPSYLCHVAQGRKRCRPARDALNADVAHAECIICSTSFNSRCLLLLFSFHHQYHPYFLGINSRKYYNNILMPKKRVLGAKHHIPCDHHKHNATLSYIVI